MEQNHSICLLHDAYKVHSDDLCCSHSFNQHLGLAGSVGILFTPIFNKTICVSFDMSSTGIFVI